MGALTSINEIICVDIVNSFFEINKLFKNKCNSVVIATDPLNIFKIHVHKSSLIGDNLDKCGAELIFDTPQIITVGKYNSHFETLFDAIQNVNTKKSNNFIIKIHPGTYYEDKEILIEKDLLIEGYGAYQTNIKFNYVNKIFNFKFLKNSLIIKIYQLIMKMKISI